MRKILLLLLIVLSGSFLKAQLDREHWFAPMVDRVGNPSPFQRLYLSTNRTTPFAVSIFNNNTLIGTVTISKGNPQKFDIQRDLIITTLQTDLFTPTTKGLHVKADFPFYANLRFSVFQHAEIVTSKGIASIGNNFYTAMAPLSAQNPILNFMTSILATEDNTNVTVSGYSPTVEFSNGTTGTTNPTLTFTLNKGQSYIIDGRGDLAVNAVGFIGAKITSNKPVNVTNGNFNGQYAVNTLQSSDILMDQAIPVEQLGNTFALVKGNGNIGLNMEGALVVATQNNTQVFLNNETLPAATLNAGQFYVVPDTKYQLQGNNHYNLYISTTQNAYVYQLLSGIDNSTATGGFNFIPALNCYLPKQIDELGFIDENEVISANNPNGILSIPTKLNLITETGATVTVNGANPPAGTGPFPMTGTSNWVTYGIPNVTGNITVNSTKAITAGITAGSDAVGYGGFFAGFPTTPVILAVSGTCAPDLNLTVDPVIYDTYQWNLNGVAIPGANSPTYMPTQSGYYTATVTMGSCAPLITAQYKVLNCTELSAASYNVCTSQTITPQFSSSTQTPVATSVNIVTQPTLGTVTVDAATGQITYVVNNPGTTGTDTFSYNFCGDNSEFPDCETVTVTVNIQTITVNNTTLNACNLQGNGVFDLTAAVVTAQTPVTQQYYPTLADAQNENAAAEIQNPDAYTAAPGTVIYVVVKNSLGCKSIAQITLGLFPLAEVADFNQTYCDDNLDGIIPIDLNTITPQILTNAAYFTVSYYPTLADATAGNANTLPLNWSFTANTTIFIRVNSPDGCPPVIKALNFIFGNKIALLSNTVNISQCDSDTDGIMSVNLNAFISQFTTDPLVTATFHNTMPEAQNGQNALAQPLNLTGTQTFFVRFERTGQCPAVATLYTEIRAPKKSDILQDVQICPSATTVLDAGSGFDEYLWSTGETTSSISGVTVGSYWVELTFNGCIFKQYVDVTPQTAPEITAIDISVNNTATVTVAGGTPPYEYSLDGTIWQTSNIFPNLSTGAYTVYVRDSLQCGRVTKNFTIIKLINTITPNGDGFNDVINYSDLMTKTDVVFRIFDRYGAEVFTGTPSNRFIWDGKLGKHSVPTATYWYILQWREFGSELIIKHTGWILVKNRDNDYFNR